MDAFILTFGYNKHWFSNAQGLVIPELVYPDNSTNIYSGYT